MVAERGEMPRGWLESPAATDREWKVFCYEVFTSDAKNKALRTPAWSMVKPRR